MTSQAEVQASKLNKFISVISITWLASGILYFHFIDYFIRIFLLKFIIYGNQLLSIIVFLVTFLFYLHGVLSGNWLSLINDLFSYSQLSQSDLPDCITILFIYIFNK